MQKFDWVVEFWHTSGSAAPGITLTVRALGGTSAVAIAFRQWVESGAISRADARDYNVRAYKVRP